MNDNALAVERTQPSALDDLLDREQAFFQTMNRRLTRILIGMNVPRSAIEDLLEEAWIAAVKHRRSFSADRIKRHLFCFLRVVARHRAVDLLRRLDTHCCYSLDREEEELMDARVAKDAETAELREFLDVLMEKVRPGNETVLSVISL